ncbi:M15 family metallopeptidase [Entomospira entomophila]|uniref:M15 family metallopeptidase n=1 Tax=Entomospira entomophila TaxID=2719988 RepID=A0A968GE58_9SPIO|nr:M15 family metallopeptidase [Entomospira entomophilus]NIZ40789.1 M15 family metallopeptidase [Entomospira entomophilus]WDI35002.1 M15 family metallopeptidase [Entomospira entomophilus]
MKILRYLLFITLTHSIHPLYADELSVKQQEKIKQMLIKEGFPSALLIDYNINEQNLQDLLRILSIVNGYKHTHTISINYDSQAQEWTITFANQQPLYWAQGRLLPRAEVNNIKQYRPYLSYQWREEPIDMRQWPLERLMRFQQSTKPEIQRTRTVYHGQYHHILYGGHDQRSIESQLTSMTFLGTSLKFHKIAAEALQRVNAKIVKASQRDASLKEFLATLTTPGSYYWRKIAGTNTISYHSYGIAVDINPKKTQQPIYWLWESQRNKEWYLVAPNDRWQIHPKVIQFFLEEGFLWGGTWPQYDIMHFEYRPELKELARLQQLFKL